MSKSDVFISIAMAGAAFFVLDHLIGERVFIRKEDAAEIVKRINNEEFNGWFDPALVMGVIETESSFQTDAVSNAGALGLMQLLPSSARDRGLEGSNAKLFDPETNIRLGMRHLKWSYDFLESRSAYPVTAAEWISSYNMGVGNALKGRINASYVKKVTEAKNRLRGIV